MKARFENDDAHPVNKVREALRFEDEDLVSAAVVDTGGRLIGRITVDDVVDLIREQAEHSVMAGAGLDEGEDTFAPAVTSAGRRAIWLGVNLVSAFTAAWVISLFADSIDRLVALAVLMPVVASMGGAAGTQSLALVIRGIALDHVNEGNRLRLLGKELSVGLINSRPQSASSRSATVTYGGVSDKPRTRRCEVVS